jgi:hypothetical protein
MAVHLASWLLRPSTGSPLCGRQQSAATSEASIRVPLLTIKPLASSWRLSSASSGSARPRGLSSLRKARQGRMIGHRIGQRQPDEAPETQPIRERFFEAPVGQPVSLL